MQMIYDLMEQVLPGVCRQEAYLQMQELPVDSIAAVVDIDLLQMLGRVSPETIHELQRNVPLPS